MSVAALLDRLADRGIEVRATEAGLEYAPVPDDTALRDEIEAQRFAIERYLDSHTACSGPFPLSTGQQALYTLHELSGRGPGYQIRCPLLLSGSADLVLVRRAVQAVVDRHPLLRSRFVFTDKGVRRFVRRPSEAAFAVTHSTRWGPEERDRWISDRSMLPFDLAGEDPARFELLINERESGPPEIVLLASFHHLAVDYVSLQRVVVDLEADYRALRAGEAVPTPAPGRPYAGWVQAERAYLRGPEAARHREWWGEILAGQLPVLELPGGRRHDAAPTLRGLEFRYELDVGMTAGIRACARAVGVTPFVVMLAAYAALLAPGGKRGEAVVGVSVEGRGPTDSGIGFYVNTLPLRLAAPPDAGFATLTTRARTALVEALKRGRFPFASIVERIHPSRNAATPAVAQAMFNWLRFAPAFLAPPTPERLILDVLRLSGVRPAGVSHDLVLTVEDRGDTLSLLWGFESRVLSPEMAQELAEAFAALLAEAVRRPGVALKELHCLAPPVPAVERETIEL